MFDLKEEEALRLQEQPGFLHLIYKIIEYIAMYSTQSAAGLLTCSHQANMRMRSHRLLRLDDNKSAASCQHA